MSDTSNKLQDKRGSVSIDLDEKKLFAGIGISTVLGISYLYADLIGVVTLLISAAGLYAITSMKGYDEGGAVRRITNGFLAVFMLPLYPFKKMLDYSEDLEESKDEK